MARVPGYESGARMTGGQMRSPDMYQGLGDLAKTIYDYGVEKKVQYEEDQNIALASDMANAELELSRRMAEIGTNSYDVQTGKYYDPEGNEIEGDLVDYAGTIYNDVMSPYMDKWGDRIPAKTRAAGMAEFQSRAIDINRKVRTDGIVNNYSQQYESILEQRKNGIIETEKAWEMMDGLISSYPIDDVRRKSLQAESRSGLLMVDFDTLFQQDSLAAIQKFKSGFYAELGEDQESKMWSKAQAYARQQIEAEMEDANNALNNGWPVNIDPGIKALASEMGMPEAAAGMVAFEATADEGVLLASSHMDVIEERVRSLTEKMDELGNAGDIDGAMEVKQKRDYFASIQQKKIEWITSDPVTWAEKYGYDVDDFVEFSDNPNQFVRERDALRIELADKEGIPYEAIPIFTEAASKEAVNYFMGQPADVRAAEVIRFKQGLNGKQLQNTAASLKGIDGKFSAALVTDDPYAVQALLTTDSLPENFPRTKDEVFRAKYNELTKGMKIPDKLAGAAYDSVRAIYDRRVFDNEDLTKESDIVDAVKEDHLKYALSTFGISDKTRLQSPNGSYTEGFKTSSGKWVDSDSSADMVSFFAARPHLMDGLHLAKDALTYGQFTPVPGEQGKYYITDSYGEYYRNKHDEKPYVFDASKQFEIWSTSQSSGMDTFEDVLESVKGTVMSPDPLTPPESLIKAIRWIENLNMTDIENQR